MQLFFEKASHEEAARQLREKPAVTREVFDRMEPELRARAFTVSGIENLDTLQRMRDAIARLPEGVPWEELKAEVAAEALPYFVDPDADAETQAGQARAAERRAELLLRHHGFQAYAVSEWRNIEATRDALPYLRYWTMGDGKVRDSHRALDGLILRADSPFWADHYPPWDWGCRCMVTQITEEEVAEIRAEDASAPPEEQRVLEGNRLEWLEQQGRISRGPTMDVSVASPEREGRSYRFDPRALQVPLADVLARYDAPALETLKTWASKITLPGSRTLWDWMQGGEGARG